MESSNEIMVSSVWVHRLDWLKVIWLAAGRFELEFIPEGESEFIRFGIE